MVPIMSANISTAPIMYSAREIHNASKIIPPINNTPPLNELAQPPCSDFGMLSIIQFLN